MDPGLSSLSSHDLMEYFVCHCRRYCKGQPRILESEATFCLHMNEADEEERFLLEALNFPRELKFPEADLPVSKDKGKGKEIVWDGMDEVERYIFEALNVPREPKLGEAGPSKGKGKGKEILSDYTLEDVLHKVIPRLEPEPKPEGKVEVINGVRTYVATPTNDYPKNKAVLFLPDILGIDLPSGQLLADDFARHGFKVYMMDYFDGDPVPRDEMIAGKFDTASWFLKHRPEVTRPFLGKVIDALKEQGVTEFAAAGYAFGARHAFDLAFEKVIKVAAVAHPTLLRIPRDFKKFKKTGIPLLLSTCGIDPVFPPESQAQADAVLGGGTQTSELYRRVHFPLCMHGFTVRGDLRDPVTKAGREGAFRATVEFFWEHF